MNNSDLLAGFNQDLSVDRSPTALDGFDDSPRKHIDDKFGGEREQDVLSSDLGSVDNKYYDELLKSSPHDSTTVSSSFDDITGKIELEKQLLGLSPTKSVNQNFDSSPNARSNLLDFDDGLSSLPPAPVKSEENIQSIIDDPKAFVDAFIESESANEYHMSSNYSDIADKFTDSDPELDEIRYKPEDFHKSDQPASDLLNASPTAGKTIKNSESFKDVIEDSLSYGYDDSRDTPASLRLTPTVEITPSAPVEPPSPEVEPPPQTPVKYNIKIKTRPSVTPTTPGVGFLNAEEMFFKLKLNTWFTPGKLHPVVESLIYWRDPVKSGVVFGSILVVLLSLSYFSLISVVAYVSLLTLVGTFSFRIYKNVTNAIQKTSDAQPFKEILDLDLTLPQDKVQEVADLAVVHVNASVNELRRLFLVEDIVDSVKFGVLLWGFTYVGSWFNGMTLIILAFVALFTLPKVYETNKTQIDANLDVVRTKIAEITSKVKAAIPLGKKEEKKEE